MRVFAPAAHRVRVSVIDTTAGALRWSRTLSLAADGTRTVSAPLPIRAGAATVAAVAVATDAAGRTLGVARDEVYLNATRTDVFTSTAGPLDAHLRRVRATADPRARARAIERIKGAAAKQRVRRFLPRPGLRAPTDITISGTMLWTDATGTTHPIRRAPVEIRDRELFGSDLVTTVRTDDAGRYSVTVDNNDGIGQGGRDIFVRVLARAGAGDVQDQDDKTYFMQSVDFANVANGTALSIGLTAGNVSDNHTAFSVQDAMVTIGDALLRLRGSALPGVLVDYPTTMSTSNYSRGKLHVLRLDRFDHDVIHHEYGHYVADRLDIEDNPGGNHALGENLGERLGKDKGVRLAWGEGWPTFFAVSGQRSVAAASLGIPNLGDDRYTDTEDSTIDYSLETARARDGGGEDNELAVQRVLWDIYDNQNDTGDTDVALRASTIWNRLDSANAKTLSQALNAIQRPMTSREAAPVGCITTEHAVAPAITAPADRSRAPINPANFTWTANGGGPSFRNDSFSVYVWNDNFTRSILTSQTQSGTSWRPTRAEWQTIVNGGNAVVNVVVRGRQGAGPRTGPYRSCPIRLAVWKLDLMFVIDTTGSMSSSLAAVSAASNQIVDTIAATDADYRVGVVDFKDHPVAPYGDAGDYPARTVLPLSKDRAQIRSALDGLRASGGGDTPEAVHSGVMAAIGENWRADARRAIVVIGDAAPHEPEPITNHTLQKVLDAAYTVDPIMIYPIDIANPGIFAGYANGTGGRAFSASAAGLVTALGQAFDAIATAPFGAHGGPYVGGRTVRFDASSSIDLDGRIVKYEWDVDNDRVFDLSSSKPVSTYRYPSAYQGKVALRVTDDVGLTSITITTARAGP